MRSAALIAFVAGLVAVVVFEVVPWLGRERDFPAEIPSPPALQVVSLDVVPAGRSLCMAQITADPHGRQVRFTVGTYKRPGPALDLTLSGRGYRATAHQSAGFADNATLRLPLEPPSRPTLVRACITNRGTHRIALYSANDRSRSRATVEVAGRSVSATPAFGFWEPRPVSIADRAGVTVKRIATFRGFLGHAWFIWLLLALFCVGMPIALGGVIWLGLRRPGSD
jgi:hypothetical protein